MRPVAHGAETARASRLRLDKWLWHARFFRTRSLAARFVEENRVRVDGRVIDKPGAMIAPGNTLTFPLGPSVRVVRVVALGERRGPAPEARTLYVDLAGSVGQSAPIDGNPAGVILAPLQRAR